MAKQLDIKVVSEGVETVEQAETELYLALLLHTYLH
ncbi:hypothetical protein ACTPEM_25725 [Clostridioides difficile]